MPEVMRYVLQALNYALFMALVWYFSAAPAFTLLQPDQAVITLAFSHAGQRREECRQRSAEEMAKLAANMRVAQDCPRERSPVTIELLLDGKHFIKEVANAPGLYGDLGIDVYRSAKVPAGTHTLTVHMNDNVRVEGPTHSWQETVTLVPTQLMVVDFNSDTGKFFIH